MQSTPHVWQWTEPCAITCRVAPSFLRVGHVELFGRRARAGAGGEAASLDELRLIVKHAIFREYPEVIATKPSVQTCFKRIRLLVVRI